MNSNRYAEDEHRWRQLMSGAQQGDRSAYELLLTEISVVIERYLRSRFGAIDMLEDCVQECLLVIHKARHTYNPMREFRPWMFTLVRHRMIDLLRERDCRIQASVEMSDAEPDLTDPEHIHRLIDGVRVLAALSPDYREAVALVKYAGMTTLEVSGRLGITESAVKARLRRGLAEIHRQLEIEGSII